MEDYWAIDLGTTNSIVARWDKNGEVPEIVHLDTICRPAESNRELDLKSSIPTVCYILPPEGVKSFLGALPFFQRNFFLGRQALLGRQAIERDGRIYSASYVSGFKPFLMRDGFRTLTRVRGKSFSASRVACLFIRELLYELKKKTGVRPRNVTFSVPVDSYESYRAQLRKIARQLGISRFRTIDEPVAAAIGYGLSLDEPQYIIVIDFGGGTLDLALIRLDEHTSERGGCQVIAKTGTSVGGEAVDRWLVEEFCKHTAYDLPQHTSDPNTRWWYRMIQAEACRVKESLFFNQNETFYLTPPEELQNFEMRVFFHRTDFDKPFDFSRQDLIRLLEERGVYTMLERCLDTLLDQARERGINSDKIREVLMTGGSTLLPGIYARVEQMFGRDRVRAWQPFNAVAFGACAYAGGKFIKSDFITHEYAFLTHDPQTHEPKYTVIIHEGTPFPSTAELWKGRLTPTCPLGEPEKIFKLVICEIGKRHTWDQEFVWDSLGNLHAFKAGDDKKSLIIPLNDINPTLGDLNPPHSPSDKTARLEVSFMINEERWLCATVLDLKTGKQLLVRTPVIRLK